MKIRIDNNNTVVSRLPLVKEKIKEFKSYFTERDLLRMFHESTPSAETLTQAHTQSHKAHAPRIRSTIYF